MFDDSLPWYFASSRKITAAFGTLFDNIVVYRFSGNGGTGDITKTIRVPLSYAESEKWARELQEYVHSPLVLDKEDQKPRLRRSLPRMSFELTNIQYDKGRKLQTTGAILRPNSNYTPEQVTKMLNPVPFDFAYDLNIAVKNIDDGCQIIEQILPSFTPSWNMTIKDIPELGITRDVPVIFNGITKSDTYEGAPDDDRLITWTLSFIAKGYMYPGNLQAAGGIIKKAIIDITSRTEDVDSAEAGDTVITEVVPESANKYDSNYEIITNIVPDSNGE